MACLALAGLVHNQVYFEVEVNGAHLNKSAGALV